MIPAETLPKVVIPVTLRFRVEVTPDTFRLTTSKSVAGFTVE
jgi:hypothetical protein